MTHPTCSTERHEAIKADPVRWGSQEFAGTQGAGGEVLDLRHCLWCKSTLALPVER